MHITFEHYRELSLSEIVADLQQTMCDLYYNAGERHLEPLILRLFSLGISEEAEPSLEAEPSVHLIDTMQELLKHDANLRTPRAQELMSVAVDEIMRLASAR